MKHTPGPWKYYPNPLHELGNAHFIGVSDANCVGGVNPIAYVIPQSATPGVREANAHLIAAAPALLQIAEAYRNLLRTMAHTDGEVATFHHVASVIAKARGES